MSNNLAHVRAREAAENWLADRKLALPTPPRVSASWAETAMADAFAAGFTETDGNGRQFACCFFELGDRTVLTVNSARGVPGTVEVNGVRFEPAAIVQVETPGEDTAVAHGQVVEFPCVTSREQAERLAHRDDPTRFTPVPGFTGMDPEIVSALIATAGETERPHHRPGGVADLTAFRLQTPDPRFDPDGPVCVNGYLYHPAKEN
jgi:hypothetical protein